MLSGYTLQVTESTRRRLSEPFLLGARGAINFKGKDPPKTRFLAGKSADIITMILARKRGTK